MREGIELVLVTPEWERFDELLDLQYAVLYRDFGVEHWQDWHQPEAGGVFVAAIEGDRVVGCVRLLLEDAAGRTAQLRQLAVAPGHQGDGIGSGLVGAIEQWARERGISEIWLKARETAFGFYQRHGYEFSGEPFMSELTKLPHREMRKKLAV